jgi:hypothetical protein
MHVKGWNRKVNSHSTASHTWDIRQIVVENRFSNDYMSSEEFTEVESDEGMIGPEQGVHFQEYLKKV